MGRWLIVCGLLWYIRTGGPWRQMPPEYGSPKTVARYYRKWLASGLLRQILETLEQDMRHRAELGDIDLLELHEDLTNEALATEWWETVRMLRMARRMGLYGGLEPE